MTILYLPENIDSVYSLAQLKSFCCILSRAYFRTVSVIIITYFSEDYDRHKKVRYCVLLFIGIQYTINKGGVLLWQNQLQFW